MRRLVDWLLRLTLFTAFGLLIAVGLLSWRLSTGPLSLEWFIPRMEAALAPADGQSTVSIGDVQLRFGAGQRTIDLLGIDVRLEAADGRPLLIFPELEAELSIKALLQERMVALSRIVARAPSLILTRTENGMLGMHSIEHDDDAVPALGFADIFRRFVDDKAADDRFAYLKQIRIDGGRLAFYDRTKNTAIHAKNAHLLLIKDGEGAIGRIDAQLVQPNGLAPLQWLGSYDEKADLIRFVIDGERLFPADIPSLLPASPGEAAFDLSGLRLPIDIELRGELGLDGTLSPLRFSMEAGGGIADMPALFANPLDIDGATATGRIGADVRSMIIDELRLSSGEAVGLASGKAAWRSGDLVLDATLEASDLPWSTLHAFWPRPIAPKARDWASDNIQAGHASSASLAIDIGPGHVKGQPLSKEAMDGALTFEGLDLRYAKDMPLLRGASGKVGFDAREMRFAFEGGQSAGVELQRGEARISNPGRPGEDEPVLVVSATTTGSAAAMLSLLDHPPLGLAGKIGVSPPAVAGKVELRFDITSPLGENIAPDRIETRAHASLRDVALEALPNLPIDIEVEDGQFEIDLGAGRVDINGQGTVAGLPLDIAIERPSSEEPTFDPILRLEGPVSASWLQRFAPDLATAFEGEAGISATITETDKARWIDFDADLEAIGFKAPGLAWQKRPGEAGRLLTSIAWPKEGGSISVKQFNLDTTGLRAGGRLEIDPDSMAPSSLFVEHLRIGDTDAKFSVKRSSTYGHDILVQAKMLDLDALLEDGDGREREDDESRALPPFRIGIDSDRLLFNGLNIANFAGDAIHDEVRWQFIDIDGRLKNGGKVAVVLNEEQEVQRLSIRADDAGHLIEGLDLGSRIEGGELKLDATIRAQTPFLDGNGTLTLHKFQLRDAPLLARLLTVASFRGIDNLLDGDGIYVDHLRIPFSAKTRQIKIDKARFRGSELGLTMDGIIDRANERLNLNGTIVPVYTLNRFLGRVPVIGQILTGEDGIGAFAATYQIKGPIAGPSVYVNPLSILTPGFVRDFFNGLAEGSLEPPTIRPSDD